VLLAALELDGALLEPLVEPAAAPLSCFAGSDEVEALDEDDGAAGEVLSEPLALLEPPAALSFFSDSVEVAALDEEEGALGVVVALDEELSLFFDASTLIDVEPEPDGVVEPAEDDAEPAGAAGVVVDEDDDAEPAGAGVVVVLRETARSPSLSQPVRIPAPSARETATAKVVSFICYVLRGLGYTLEEQDSGLLH